MKNQVIIFGVTLMLAFSTSAVFSQNENIWLGGKSGGNADWFVASNWSKHRVPNETDHVIVPANTSFPVVNGTAVVQALYMASGTEIQLRDNAVLVIMHNKNNGKGLYITSAQAVNELQFGLSQSCELVIYQGMREVNPTNCPIEEHVDKTQKKQN